MRTICDNCGEPASVPPTTFTVPGTVLNGKVIGPVRMIINVDQGESMKTPLDLCPQCLIFLLNGVVDSL